jgi:hypothetical protein
LLFLFGWKNMEEYRKAASMSRTAGVDDLSTCCFYSAGKTWKNIERLQSMIRTAGVDDLSTCCFYSAGKILKYIERLQACPALRELTTCPLVVFIRLEKHGRI